METLGNNLKQMGFAAGGEQPSYRCPLCRDSGVIMQGDQAVPCRCTLSRDFARRQKRAGMAPHLARMRFEGFDLSYYATTKIAGSSYSCREGARRTMQAAQSFVEAVSAGRPVNGLLFEGSVGSGKTFLAAAIANELIARRVEMLFIVVPDFLDEIRSSYGDHNDVRERELMAEVKNVPVLILDDLGAHNYTEWAVRTLYAIINYRVNHELPVVVTTNLTEKERDELLGARINSRLVEVCSHYRLKASVDIRKALRTKENGVKV